MSFRPLSELIVVPGHAVFIEGCTTADKVGLESSRVGGYHGEGKLYAEHVEAGVRRAKDSESLLVFSGGMTQEKAGMRSEGESYWEIARDHGWLQGAGISERAVSEQFARDSFENLLFSIARFKKQIGKWPQKMTALGWQFKARRFDLHRRAMKWSAERFQYIGVNNPEGAALEKAIISEAATIQAVERDLFLTGPEFLAKRELRDPFHRQHPYRGIDPELDNLFDFLDRNTYSHSFPWAVAKS